MSKQTRGSHLMRGRGQQLMDANRYIYSVQVPATRPAMDYSACVTPQHADVAVPLEGNPL